MKYFALLAGLLMVVACGSSDHGGFVSPSDGGSGGSGGKPAHAGAAGKAGASGGEGGDGGEAGAYSLAPTVEITSPVAVSDPSKGGVLTEDHVTVTCSVVGSPDAGASGVLTSSVKIQMFGTDGKQIGTDGSVMATTNTNEYAARFVLVGTAPTGLVSFTCSASDQSASPHTGSATVKTFYDGGPAIVLTSPADKSAHSLGPLLFKFSALPSLLADGDDGAAVEGVTLSVNGVTISKITPLTNMPGYYQSDIDLSDPKTFSPKPVGSVPVAITATNKRGTTALQNFTFVVDSTGPVITVVSPPTTSVQFVGGQTTIEFTVVDEAGGSGVDPSTVQVTVNMSPVASYMEGNYWHILPDGKTFDYSFNTLDYPSQLGVTIKISAFDKAGNMALGTAPFYYLDNVPPIVDMQPPTMQERTKSGQLQLCSDPFDPLGESPKDVATILTADKTTPSVNFFRALVWDEGNVADGQGVEFYSDVDTNTGVRLYFQQDTTKPLLKNVKGAAGGLCNEIADATLPFIPLSPITPTGSAYYDANAPLPPSAMCSAGTSTTPPDKLCGGNTILTRVIQHDAAVAGTPVAVVYGFQSSTGSLCAGGQFDLTTVIGHDGWVCAAVVAQDKIGNRAVSAPIRLCLDADDKAGANYVGKPSCSTGANPPTCVAPLPSGCVPPGHFAQTVIEKL
jgi:hypothetical protein